MPFGYCALRFVSVQRPHPWGARSNWLFERQQRVDAAVWPGGQFLQGVGQPGHGLDAVQAGGFEQRLNRRGALAGSLGAGEQPVLLADGDRANGILNGVMPTAGLCRALVAH